MGRFLRKIRTAIGPRGGFLLAWAFLDVLFGVGMLNADAATRQSPTYSFVAQLMPLTLWGALWLLIAAILTTAALRVRDDYGFIAAISIKVLWGLLMLGGWVTGDIPRGYVTTGIWLGAAMVIAVCSRHLPIVTPDRED